ncbi:Testis-specific Y-encoded-like protein [Actinidia chinensis var. chinensis]|uniref:Testis-specific Y-encoded-like protein n=1 Tax=Actinidia chinensis var. chinensis TaxID=1590841 RepID=A0A2R6R2W6_ACTCC|nr:Testis-specific Y-encoded-like protein [Actinidia chinensis var. chinensis]
MEVEVTLPRKRNRFRVKKMTLEAVLRQCHTAIESLENIGSANDGGDADGEGSPPPCRDKDTDELCDLLKSRVECPDFLEKLESAQLSLPQNIAEEGSSWDVISENDLWDGGSNELDHEDYVLVSQEDIMEGIACFVTTYLLSLDQTKDLTPNQLQEALSKAFSVNKKKGKIRKAWDGSQVVYNVASWGATAIGIYQNPVLLGAASTAFWTSCQVISKLF